MTGEEIQLETGDRVRLGATLFRPQGRAARAVAIQAATGVKQGYYAKFAGYLAERGFCVLTVDYRGIGRSRPVSLKGYRATLPDWAERDAPAAFDFLERAAPGARLMAVGHSIGGVLLGLVPQRERIAAALVVGSQSGYWRHWRGAQRAGLWTFTQVFIPAVTRLYGYAAASRIGMGEDLPAGVALDWARSCRHPEYVVGTLGAHAKYAGFRAPLRAVAASDDRYAPLAAVEALLRLYPSARGEIRRVRPEDVGARRIGHFGFFREPFRDTLWREAADWLERH